MPLRKARAADRSGPSVRARLRCLGSSPAAIAAALYLAGVRAGGRRFGAGSEPAALPLRQAPQIAGHLVRIELAAGEVHVRRADEPPLVAGERHPLGQDIV